MSKKQVFWQYYRSPLITFPKIMIVSLCPLCLKTSIPIIMFQITLYDHLKQYQKPFKPEKRKTCSVSCKHYNFHQFLIKPTAVGQSQTYLHQQIQTSISNKLGPRYDNSELNRSLHPNATREREERDAPKRLAYALTKRSHVGLTPRMHLDCVYAQMRPHLDSLTHGVHMVTIQ